MRRTTSGYGCLHLEVWGGWGSGWMGHFPVGDDPYLPHFAGLGAFPFVTE